MAGFGFVTIVSERGLRNSFVFKAHIGDFARISNAAKDRKVDKAWRRKRRVASRGEKLFDLTRQGGVKDVLHQNWK